MDIPISQIFIDASLKRLGEPFAKIEHCVNQLTEDDLHLRPDESMNSISNIILHVCGNLRQWIISRAGGADEVRRRWEEFDDRKRYTRDELLQRLTETTKECRDVIASLSPDALTDERTVQGFDETVLSAVYDSICHLSGHSQEIVYITRMRKGDDYQFKWQPSTPEEGLPRGN